MLPRPRTFPSIPPRTHFSGQATVALDSTRDGQPGDFTQARTRGPEVFCIGFPFVEIRLCRHGAACQVAHGRS